MTVFIPDRQGIIGDKPTRKYLLITLARFIRLGEVIGKITSNQIFTRDAGHLHHSLVHVSNFAFRADSY